MTRMIIWFFGKILCVYVTHSIAHNSSAVTHKILLKNYISNILVILTAINLQNSGDISRLEGEKDISRLRKKDRAQRGKKTELAAAVSCARKRSRKERETERLRSIARRLARDAERFLTVAFLPVSPPVTRRRARARDRAQKTKIYSRALSLLPVNRRFLYASKENTVFIFFLNLEGKNLFFYLFECRTLDVI